MLTIERQEEILDILNKNKSATVEELAAELFTTEDEKTRAYKGRGVLVQGVIDCIVELEDGTIALFDYKTDRLTREELADRTLAEAKMRDKHSEQLYYYSLAIKRIFGRAPTRVEVYSLAFGDTLDVKIQK